MCENLSWEQKLRFQALYNKDTANNDDIKRIETNVFTEEEVVRGQSHTWLRVYDDISRANHSCQPNAVAHHDRICGMGVLRALQNIGNGQEIFIDYLSSIEESVNLLSNRQAELLNNYGFTCQCPVCSFTGVQLRAYEQDRARASERYIRLQGPVFVQLSRRNAENKAMVAKLNHAEDLVQLFRQHLNVKDDRLAWVYNKIAEIHYELYKIAPRVTPQPHCQSCQGGREWHLQAALEAFRKMRRIHLRTHGPSHPVMLEDQRLENKILDLTDI